MIPVSHHYYRFELPHLLLLLLLFWYCRIGIIHINNLFEYRSHLYYTFSYVLFIDLQLLYHICLYIYILHDLHLLIIYDNIYDISYINVYHIYYSEWRVKIVSLYKNNITNSYCLYTNTYSLPISICLMYRRSAITA